MSTTGVTYYKLENGYPGDVTKGCGLSGSEIDKNFHFLRGYDIKTGEFEDGKIILTRVNGDEIDSGCPLSSMKPLAVCAHFRMMYGRCSLWKVKKRRFS